MSRYKYDIRVSNAVDSARGIYMYDGEHPDDATAMRDAINEIEPQLYRDLDTPPAEQMTTCKILSCLVI